MPPSCAAEAGVQGRMLSQPPEVSTFRIFSSSTFLSRLPMASQQSKTTCNKGTATKLSVTASCKLLDLSRDHKKQEQHHNTALIPTHWLHNWTGRGCRWQVQNTQTRPSCDRRVTLKTNLLGSSTESSSWEWLTSKNYLLKENRRECSKQYFMWYF